MYGVCASGIFMDRVALDKGMLGLCDLVNDQVIIDITDTDWSQWRYVVKLWFSESGTSRTALGLGGRLKVPTDIPGSTIKRV